MTALTAEEILKIGVMTSQSLSCALHGVRIFLRSFLRHSVPVDPPLLFVRGIVVGEFRKMAGRVMDESEQKCFVDVFIWTKYKGKKQCMELADTFEKFMSKLDRDYFLETAFYDYDEESGWSLAQIVLRTYLE